MSLVYGSAGHASLGPCVFTRIQVVYMYTSHSSCHAALLPAMAKHSLSACYEILQQYQSVEGTVTVC